MKNPKKLYIEQLLSGKYGVKESKVKKPILIALTQAKAIAKARKLSPKELLVERVRNTKKGGRDQWRSPN